MEVETARNSAPLENQEQDRYDEVKKTDKPLNVNPFQPGIELYKQNTGLDSNKIIAKKINCPF
ncbi:hypothetical protein P872_21715 [Rhodonellum psychrophilum GCM71 = DSM 17998]|uniref:Uncharacterized protein n=1 Tax=Rhodonellum psychrophilum GCM71 = DSM 17998 TaxID=1123057 RepID=U5BSG4_9BACT|nr:hypothetical protein P872_21715 [Rhodonellum psychrophilum GCM71 = DSM 17998]